MGACARPSAELDADLLWLMEDDIAFNRHINENISGWRCLRGVRDHGDLEAATRHRSVADEVPVVQDRLRTRRAVMRIPRTAAKRPRTRASSCGTAQRQDPDDHSPSVRLSQRQNLIAFVFPCCTGLVLRPVFETPDPHPLPVQESQSFLMSAVYQQRTAVAMHLQAYCH
jgi:hypothetical protein